MRRARIVPPCRVIPDNPPGMRYDSTCMDLLKGRTILDCSTLLPGPFIGKLLARKGARVIKIESPDRPDPARQLSPIYYADLNDCKEHLQLNLTKPEDRERFAELVREADGLIEGFRPAAKLKLGLDEPTLHVLNPRLAIASLVGFPEDGPWRDKPGHDLGFEALSGLLSLFNEMPALPLADFFGAYEGALALVTAMDHASRTGHGSRVVISLFEALKELQSRLVREFRETGRAPRYGETLFSGLYPCYRVYRAKCGRRVTVGAIEEKFWVETCRVLGVPELAPRGYATGEQGRETIARVQDAFAARDWKDWAPLFEAAQCCVEPVLEYPEVF